MKLALGNPLHTRTENPKLPKPNIYIITNPTLKLHFHKSFNTRPVFPKEKKGNTNAVGDAVDFLLI